VEIADTTDELLNAHAWLFAPVEDKTEISTSPVLELISAGQKTIPLLLSADAGAESTRIRMSPVDDTNLPRELRWPMETPHWFCDVAVEVELTLAEMLIAP
jgi:hypothetical protein